MVKTRHSGQDFPPDFSLERDRSRSIDSKQNVHLKGDDDDQRPAKRSGRPRQAYNLDDSIEKVEIETRLRPRTGPSHAFNYLDDDSSDDDAYHRRQKTQFLSFSPRRRRSEYKSKLIKQEILNEQKESMRLRGRGRMNSRVEESEDDSPMLSLSRRSLRTRIMERERDNSNENQRTRQVRPMDTDEDDHVELSVRRSSRSRRQTYKMVDHDVKEISQERHDIKDNKDLESEDQEHEDARKKEFSDMYSRVKRKRIKIKRNMYGIPINTDSEHEDQSRNNSRATNDDEDESEDDGEEDEEKPSKRRSLRGSTKPILEPMRRQYSLREHKPRTELYKAPVEEKKSRRSENSVFATTPTKKGTTKAYQSPAQRRSPKKRRAHNSSSTSSSSSSDSSDEEKFQRRKSKSMTKARSKMLPMNFTTADSKPSGITKDRIRSGASMADIEPMTIDRNITFDSIGGLGKHVRALKEMVVFPLLYDKVFKRFKVDPPKGVLFYGPPGVGKTLVARALANECSTGDKKVSFFMRKGADCLSEWVGESERQLRLLFDQAYKFRPSIIFFDEIDGLAPVRSSRQDQIHSSIVSTLLALMDGLDSRGEIVVIGATNRIDSLDPALRRPGRFDREFLFPLPNFEARKQILNIQTASWQPKLNDMFISQLAEKCVGYCGADLKALCTEAAMHALRRRYPQIYLSSEALELDESTIQVSARDFFDAIQTIVPTSQRSVSAPGKSLSLHICPLLQQLLDDVMMQLNDIFPASLAQINSLNAAATTKQAQLLGEKDTIWDELGSDEDEDGPSIYVTSQKGKSVRRALGEGTSKDTAPIFLNFTSSSRQATFRPRMILAGAGSQGQTSYIGPAVIHQMESLPVHVLDLPVLYAVTAKTPEESVANIFHEAKRKTPSIVYIPQMDKLWNVMSQTETLKSIFLTQLQCLDPTLPLLLLATCDQPFDEMDSEVQCLFNQYTGEVASMTNPGHAERHSFFEDLLLKQALKAPPQRKQAVLLNIEKRKMVTKGKTKNRNHNARSYHIPCFTNHRNMDVTFGAERMLEVLPKAAPVKPRELTKEEIKQLEEKEDLTLMELRIFLRDVLSKLGSDRKFSIFTKPVDIEDAPDYYEVIETPMDLSTMMSKVDLHEYNTVADFSADIDLVCSNALEYNPDRGPTDRIIRHRACSLRDTAYAIIKTELDKDFERTCVEIQESRARRGRKSTEVPKFYHTKPKKPPPNIPSYLDQPKPVRSIPEPEGERFSKRVRGLTIEPPPALESVEKRYHRTFPLKEEHKPESAGTDFSSPCTSQESTLITSTNSESKITVKKDSEDKQTSKSTIKKKPKKCVWCKPKRRRIMIGHKRKLNSDAERHHQNKEQEAAKEVDVDVNSEEDKSIELTPKASKSDLELKIDVNSESKEVKSAIRCSTRRRSSPAMASPRGVVTRRSSMSPRGEVLKSPISLPEMPNLLEQKDEDSSANDTAISTTDTVMEATSAAETGMEVTSRAGTVMEVTSATDTVMEVTSATDTVMEVTSATDEEAAVTENLLSNIQNKVTDPSLEVLPTPISFEPKPSVVKRLDLDTVAVDSGVGSSVDSNGDSRDSLDNHVKEASTKPIEQKENKENNINNNAKAKAKLILNETSKKLIIDKGRLVCLLNVLVTKTHNFYVERLEKIHVSLSQVIYRHRTEYDRTRMIEELEQKVENLTKQMPSTSLYIN